MRFKIFCTSRFFSNVENITKTVNVEIETSGTITLMTSFVKGENLNPSVSEAASSKHIIKLFGPETQLHPIY